MATNYPSGFDTYNEPSLPEETSLSSAGSATRNHTEHHRDLGDAVEAIEVNAALKGHDHSGADDRVHGIKLLQANTHQSADTDSGLTAIHHTLGTLPFQAAAGNHIHDYNGGTIINKPLILCTSATRPTDPYFGLQVYEADTNQVRVWGQFGSRTPVPGLFASDDFERTNANDLGSTLWEQTYFDEDNAESDATHGKMATPDGHAASWTTSGSATSRCIARRIRAEDKETLSDDQILTFNTGDFSTQSSAAFKTPSPSVDFYLRMSADGQSYWRVVWGWFYVEVFYTTTGPANEELMGRMLFYPTATANGVGVIQLIGRSLSVYWSGALVGEGSTAPAEWRYAQGVINDAAAATAKGEDNRGWGIGMVGLDDFNTTAQLRPASLARVVMEDVTHYQSVPRWTLLPVASVPVVRLYQGVSQTVPPSLGAVIEWHEEDEDNFNCFDRNASLTDIVINEPGLYSIDCSLSWGPLTTNDWILITLLINGVETPRQSRRVMLGGSTFSQTVDFSTKVRLDANDRVSIRAKHSKGVALNTRATKIVDNVESRFDLAYIAP